MKRFKQGVSLVAVLIALFVASYGGEWTADPSGISVDSTYQVTKDGAYLIGAQGLHW
jgi:hypothetical protein